MSINELNGLPKIAEMVMSDINCRGGVMSVPLIIAKRLSMAEDNVPTKKQKLSHVNRDELRKVSREELIDRVLNQQQEIDSLKTKQTQVESLDDLHQVVEKLKQQVTDSTQQENKLVMRLASKEQELQELVTQIQELKQSQNPSCSQLSSLLLDPAINLMFFHMKQEIDSLKNKLEQAQNDLAAWKFTPDSQTGKRLMAKCRMLLQENEDLGKNVSSGRIAKLEGDIALQKTLIMEMKKSETVTEEFLAEMDEDMEAMQGTVYLLQQELKEAKERLQKYESGTTVAAAGRTMLHESQNGRHVSPPSPLSLVTDVAEDNARLDSVVVDMIGRHDDGVNDVFSELMTGLSVDRTTDEEETETGGLRVKEEEDKSTKNNNSREYDDLIRNDGVLMMIDGVLNRTPPQPQSSSLLSEMNLFKSIVVPFVKDSCDENDTEAESHNKKKIELIESYRTAAVALTSHHHHRDSRGVEIKQPDLGSTNPETKVNGLNVLVAAVTDDVLTD